MELEREREGVDEAGGSPTEWVMDLRSWQGKISKLVADKNFSNAWNDQIMIRSNLEVECLGLSN